MGCTSAIQLGQGAGTSPAITAQDLSTRLYTFADDSMMGRQFGTEGNLKGTQYIANELSKLGIQPGGVGGSYFQDVPAYRVSLSPGAQVFLDGAPLAFGTDYITSFPASGRAIPVDSLQVVYGGDLSDTTTLIPPDQAAGKAILLAIRTPLQRNPGAIIARYAAAKAIITGNDPSTVRALDPLLLDCVHTLGRSRAKRHRDHSRNRCGPARRVRRDRRAQRSPRIPVRGRARSRFPARLQHHGEQDRRSPDARDARHPGRGTDARRASVDSCQCGQPASHQAAAERFDLQRRR